MGFENISPKDSVKELNGSENSSEEKINKEIITLQERVGGLLDRLGSVTNNEKGSVGSSNISKLRKDVERAQNNTEEISYFKKGDNEGDNGEEKGGLTRRDLLRASGAAGVLLAGAKVAGMLGIGKKDYGVGLSDGEIGQGLEWEDRNSNSSIAVAEESIEKGSQVVEIKTIETEKQEEIRKSNERALVDIFEKQFVTAGKVNISLNIKKMIGEYWFNQYKFGGSQALGLEQALKSLAPYYTEIKDVFKKISKETGVNIPEDLIYLAVPESHCSARAGSNAGAMGFYQLVAGTARKYGLRVDKFIDERLNPIRNAEGAARYLAHLYTHDVGKLKEKWNEDEDKLRWKLVLSRYNGGKYFKRFREEVKVGKRQVSYEEYLHSREDAINNYKEEIFKNGYFQIEISSIKELNSIIKKYDVSSEEMTKLNGGIVMLRKKIRRREKIKLPVFRESFQYKVVSGDTISGLSKRYEISQRDIKVQNNLKGDKIGIGQVLQIKVGGDIYSKKRSSARLFFEKDLKSALENLNYPEKFFAIIKVMEDENLFLNEADDKEEKSVGAGVEVQERTTKSSRRRIRIVHPRGRKKRM